MNGALNGTVINCLSTVNGWKFQLISFENNIANFSKRKEFPGKILFQEPKGDV